MTALTEARLEQRLLALRLGNRVRTDRAALRYRIACGETTAAQVITDMPPEAVSWPLGRLLVAQRRWGVVRVRRFCLHHQVSENRPLGALTERQRKVLVDALSSGRTR